MANTIPGNDLDGHGSKGGIYEVEFDQMNEKSLGYRMTESEVPLEQKKEEARVM